jgi:N-acetylglutamate synthase-like GNAT family acetyltransferase
MAGLMLRDARVEDAEAVAALLGELGYPNTPAFARDKLAVLLASDHDRVLAVEREGRVVGVGHLHVSELFHQPGRVGRITAIVVSADCRREGVGRALMAALEALAQEAGCIKFELTSAPHRREAHAFYEAVGYAVGMTHFTKKAPEPGA